MMMNSGLGSGLWHMGGGLLALAFLAGLVFLFAWAIKTLKKEQLLHWAILLLVVPLIGWILAMSLGGFGKWNQDSGFRRGPGMMWGSYDYSNK